MSFKVTNVIDDGTLEVSPDWKWNDKIGNLVKPAGISIPSQGQQGYEEARERLENIINRRKVELKNAFDLAYGKLICEVEFNGRNLAEYFH
jgi:endonuclease YncB( thermonuclease family)